MSEVPSSPRARALSIAGSTMGEYADLARRLSRAPGVAGLEVNVGAPDEVGVGLFEVREPYHSASVIAAVRREFPSDRPVLAKLRPDVSRIVEGARSCHEAGATAVVVATLSAFWHCGLALVFSVGAVQAGYRKAKSRIDRVVGAVLILLGLRLAIAR